ncbi:MAG: divalent-cation tolerance protein CutA [Thiohalomonadales bacterium]
MDTSFCLVLTTCPDKDSAHTVAHSLIEGRLAACVSILPPITSIYRWQGKIESNEELMLLIKTKNSQFSAIKEQILDVHPYELPEIISVPISNGLDQYLRWVADNVS